MAVPKLRFKEFNSDWEKEYLGNIAIFFNNQRIPLSETERQKRQGKFRYYGASGVIDYVDDYLFDGEYILIGEDGANILTRSTPLAFIVKGQFWVNNHAHIFQSKDGNNTFLATYLESLNYERFNSGTAQPKLNLDNLKKVPVANPTQEEQTKIANFLTAVDEKISQLNEQHQLMIQYKKGVMQKIFSQEIRFKDDNGEEFGEWEEKKLSDIANFRRGSFPQPYGLAKWLDPNGMPFVQVFDVSDNLKLKNFTKIKISKLAQEKSVFVKKGTLIITIQGTIGRVAKMQYDAYVDRTLLIFQSYKIDVNIDFIKYALFLLFELEKEKADGGIIKTITKETLSSFTLQLPSIKEQAQIANFLDVLDEKINNTFEQLQTVKQWKKGLLQQMLV